MFKKIIVALIIVLIVTAGSLVVEAQTTIPDVPPGITVTTECTKRNVTLTAAENGISGGVALYQDVRLTEAPPLNSTITVEGNPDFIVSHIQLTFDAIIVSDFASKLEPGALNTFLYSICSVDEPKLIAMQFQNDPSIDDPSGPPIVGVNFLNLLP